MTLITRMRQHARFRRTLRELRAMGGTTRRDLDIAPGEIRRIARQAVYG
jgi:uncharacterized protein YjiS (DUF1127 family)